MPASESVNITSLRKKGRRFTAAISENDATETVTLHPDIVSAYAISAPSRLPRDEWLTILAENDFKLAWERALATLDAGDNNSHGLKRKLRTKGFSAEIAEKVVAECARLALIDDAEFAKRLAESCLARGKGRREALAKLLRSGVPRDDAENTVNFVYSEGAELAAARRVAERKLTSLNRGSDDPPKRREKLLRHLAGKGFPFDLVNKVVDEALSGQ